VLQAEGSKLNDFKVPLITKRIPKSNTRILIKLLLSPLAASALDEASKKIADAAPSSK
jgi:hypothetical protein